MTQKEARAEVLQKENTDPWENEINQNEVEDQQCITDSLFDNNTGEMDERTANVSINNDSV